MATKYKLLSMDASGLPSFGHSSKEFVVSGVMIDEKIRTKIDNSLRKIKKKYFGDDEIVLHYVQVVRKIGGFSVLKNSDVENKFWAEIISILNNPKINLFFTIVDKNKAQVKGWSPKRIVLESYKTIIKIFVEELQKQGMVGKIVTESDIFEDPYLLKAHRNYQIKGISSLRLKGKDYHRIVSSISLVNKNNHDTEIQLADLLGVTVRLRYRLLNLKSGEIVSKIEKNKLKLIERKLKSGSVIIKLI